MPDDSNGSEVRGTGRLKPLIQIALIVGPFLSMMDSSVVNVALPFISGDFNSSLTDAQWILSGYLLALAAVLPASAFLSKRYGAGRVYMLSIVGFTLASLLCALSSNLDSLIVTRFAQGAMGAPLVPIAMDMLFGGSAERKEGASMMPTQISPLLGLVLFLAPALGPTLGGYLVAYAGWQSIFLINVPIGFVSVLLVYHYRHELGDATADSSARFDMIGSLLISVGLVLVIYAASEGPLVGWLSPQTLPFLVTGLVLIVAYVVWALRKEHPAVNLKLVRSSQTALALTISILAAVVLFSVLFLLPVFMESVQGISVMDTGLALLPQGLATGIGTVVGDRISRRTGIRFTVILGMAILTASTAGLLALNASTSAWVIAGILTGRGLALGLTIQPLLIDTIGRLSGKEIPDGNTLFNVFQRLGGTVGISLLSTYYQLRVQFHLTEVLQQYGITVPINSVGQGGSLLSTLPAAVQSQLVNAEVSGFQETMMVLVAVTIVGLILAFFIKNSRSKEE